MELVGWFSREPAHFVGIFVYYSFQYWQEITLDHRDLPDYCAVHKTEKKGNGNGDADKGGERERETERDRERQSQKERERPNRQKYH